MTRSKAALTALLVILALSGTAIAATLTLDAPTHLEPNESVEYTVYEDGDDVTASATVKTSSSNLTAYPINGTLNAAPGDYAERVTINATYNGSATDNYTVAIANATMSNYGVLPIWPSVEAIGTSGTIFVVVFGVMLAVAAARLMIKGQSAYRTGGTTPSIIMFELVLVSGWAMGMVHGAIVVLSMLTGVWTIVMAARNDT